MKGTNSIEGAVIEILRKDGPVKLGNSSNDRRGTQRVPRFSTNPRCSCAPLFAPI